MDTDVVRLTAALEWVLQRVSAGDDCPPRLAQALRHAVFPGGGRLRPLLTMAVARAAGQPPQPPPGAVDAAAAAIELVHCASLVHDDLPCFDDAALRRGVPSVQAAYGEAMAVLVGDALIFAAFETLAGLDDATLSSALVRLLARAGGSPHGMTAGQAWEGEPQIDLERYHRAKTASLFEAATVAGGLVAGDAADRWRPLGSRFGEAYQILDDIRDAGASSAGIGKPVGRDAALRRPNAVHLLGMDEALRRLEESRRSIVAAVPRCPGHQQLRLFLDRLLASLIPAAVDEPAVQTAGGLA
jgi:geranylgeranyl diphosphate synthase, type II